MYPPKVTDSEVRAVVQALITQGRLPSGAQVRASLANRYGSRGGVARIYRILAQERSRLQAPDPDRIATLQAEVSTLREQLVRSHEREDANQSHWAAEVDRLRQQVAGFGPQAHEARVTRDTYDLLRHQLRAAEQRAARLEEELLALRRSAGTAEG